MKCSVKGCDREVTQVSGFTPKCFYHLYGLPLPTVKAKPIKRKMKSAPENKALGKVKDAS
jgi:hypothetical protein